MVVYLSGKGLCLPPFDSELSRVHPTPARHAPTGGKKGVRGSNFTQPTSRARAPTVYSPGSRVPKPPAFLPGATTAGASTEMSLEGPIRVAKKKAEFGRRNIELFGHPYADRGANLAAGWPCQTAGRAGLSRKAPKKNREAAIGSTDHQRTAANGTDGTLMRRYFNLSTYRSIDLSMFQFTLR